MDTEVDRSLIETLSGGLIHLVRNAVDHGIEAPADRRRLGKEEQGRLVLRAYQDGGDVIIQVQDDGAGLDADRIREVAIKRGLLTPDRQISQSDLFALIFHPGFSTASRITGTSGRGVGMNAVQDAVDSLRGKIDVESEPGRGTTLRLILPLSLAAIQGLLVEVGRSQYLLPAFVVRESFRPKAEWLDTVKGQGRVVSIRGAILPIIDLAEVLQVPDAAVAPEEGVLVIVEYEGRLAALLVSAVLNTQNAMIRPLEGPLAGVEYVSGVVTLGQGSLALVLEVGELLRHGVTSASTDLTTGFSQDDRVETVDIGSNQVAMVDFSICYRETGVERTSRYAINAFKAREFVPMQELTPMPQAPPGFAGVLLLRDRTLPVVNLVSLLGFEPVASGEGSIIICEFGSHTIGIAVEQVNRVNYISWGEILPPPDTSGSGAGAEAVVGTILMGEEVLFVLDFEQIVQKVLSIYQSFGQTLDGVQQRKTRSRVLLVEDSTLVRQKTAEALRSAGLEVIEAANGQAALDELRRMESVVEGEEGGDQAGGGSIFDLLDLVLSDIEMPLLDGYTLAQEIKRSSILRGLPVIFHSSLTNQTIIARAKEVQADGVVAKGDPEHLALLLRQYL
jgi:chemotaxis signal transduction protein/CheY-like chemotaxis protein